VGEAVGAWVSGWMSAGSAVLGKVSKVTNSAVEVAKQKVSEFTSKVQACFWRRLSVV
jgi:hypothetical protein